MNGGLLGCSVRPGFKLDSVPANYGACPPTQDLRFSPGRWTPGFPVCWVEVSGTQAQGPKAPWKRPASSLCM